jgi:hypothetical protein
MAPLHKLLDERDEHCVIFTHRPIHKLMMFLYEQLFWLQGILFRGGEVSRGSRPIRRGKGSILPGLTML